MTTGVAAAAPSIDDRVRLSLSPGLDLQVRDEMLTLASPLAQVPLLPTDDVLRTLGDALGAGRSTLRELSDLALDHGGQAALVRLLLLVDRLGAAGALERSVLDGGMPLATLRPTLGFRATTEPRDATMPVVLSRFSSIHRADLGWVVDSPLGHAEVVVHDPRAMRPVLALARPIAPRSLSIPGLSDELVGAIVRLLEHARVLTRCPAGTPEEDADPDLMLWTRHDLLFHARSRFGRHVGPFGGGFRHIGELAPAAAVRPPPPGPVISLPVVDLDAVAATDPPLTTVIETRRSIWPDPAASLRLDQLGEFLFRVARVRWRRTMPVSSFDGREGEMEVTGRPYPSGGRAYELELYLSADRCTDLASGLYWYDPERHQLVLVRARDRQVEGLLWYASIAAAGSAAAVVVHLAARFARVAWKYDAIAYATTQKHVGVLYQTMYLVATAMGLAACALGSGDADRFAEAAGTRYVAETSVGDFMLGVPPASVGPSTDPHPQPEEATSRDH